MKKAIGLLLALCLVLTTIPASVFGAVGINSEEPVGSYVEGEAIVLVNDSVSPRGRSGSILAAYETDNLMDVSETPTTQSVLRRNVETQTSQRLVLVKSSTQSTEEMIEALSADPTVVYAEPNYYVEAKDMPADPYVDEQWGVDNKLNGNSSSPIPTVDAKIQEAWNTMDAGSSKTPVVAVLDSGVDYNHPDLNNIMWNEGLIYDELKALGGGMYGYSAFSGDDHSDPIDDEVGHGTHCASIIASEWNTIGTAGVAGTSNVQAKIMAVKFLGSGATMSGAIDGMNYILQAKNAGVNLVAVNNSWGPNVYDGQETNSVSTAVDTLGKAGVVSCFAAGNDNVNNDANTGSIVSSPYKINVGALESTGHKSPFSSYGQSTVDVMSPGSQILAATTTVNVKGDLGKNDMAPQYLPQLMTSDPDASYYYNDFESETGSVTLTVTDEKGTIINAAQETTTGYMGGTAKSISLDAVPDGESFGVEVSFTQNWDYTDLSEVYFAVQFGFANCNLNKPLALQYKDENNEWQFFRTYQGSILAARTSDKNWVELSNRFANATGIDTKKGETINFRFVPAARVNGEWVVSTMERDGSGQPASFKIDDLGIGKKAIPYFYSDGTSMATPMTTGIVALVADKLDLASKPEVIDEVIARVKGGVERKDNVANGTDQASVSMGYVDAEAAISDDDNDRVPVLNDLSVEGTTGTLTGFFFGGTEGEVTFGGQPAKILKWTEQEITIEIPASISGRQEVGVTSTIASATGNYGRDFFNITPDTVNYNVLNAPAIEYEPYDEFPITSANIFYQYMAAAGGKIMAAGFDVDANEDRFELYDIGSNTWKAIDKPAGFIDGFNMTGGFEKIYCLYMDENEKVQLGIYNTISGTWSNFECNANYYSSIVVYQDKLLAIGGIDNVTGDSLASVKVLNPDNGEVMDELAPMPNTRASVTAMQSGDRLVVYGGSEVHLKDKQGNIEIAASFNPDIFDTQAYTSTLVFDGTSWQEKADGFILEDIDPMQTVNYALGATKDSLLAVGPVSGLATDKMIDTWSLDFTAEQWAPKSDVLYSQAKTTRNIGVAYKNQFYILAYTGHSEDPLIFRALDVETYDIAADPVGPTPTPTPDPDPTVNPSPTTNRTGSGVNTGDTANIGIWIVLLVVALGAVIFLGYRLKKKN